MDQSIKNLHKSKDGKPLDPYKTICVLKHKGKEVGRVPATAKKAEAYITEMVRTYGDIQIEYEEDPTGGLLAVFHGGHRHL